MATLPVLLINGQTADANDVMADFIEIYTDIDETNVQAANKTGTGKFVLQTSPTITSPTITGPIISGVVTLPLGTAAAPSLTFTGDTNTGLFSSGADTVDITRAGASKLRIDANVVAIASDVIVDATQKLRLDGSASGDTYISETSGNHISFFSGGSERAYINESFLTLSSIDLAVSSTKKIYFDGVGDTYLSEEAANDLRITVGGTRVMRMLSSRVETSSSVDFAVQATQKLFLDGGGDTYIYEQVANTISVFTGGTDVLDISASATSVNVGDFFVNAGTATISGNTSASGYKFYNNIEIISGGADILTLRPITLPGHSAKLDITGTISTASGNRWDMASYTAAGDAASNGYVSVTIDGTTYKLSTRA